MSTSTDDFKVSDKAQEYIQRLRKENDAAGELIVELAQAHLEAEQRVEMLEEVLKRIAEDSRPYAGWSQELASAAEHWKHVASQRREWAIEALHHLSLEDTNEDEGTPVTPTRSSIRPDEDPREKRGAFGRNPGWE